MANQFRKKLKRILLLGTLIPTAILVIIFFFKYQSMNLDTLTENFKKEEVIFDLTLEKKWETFKNDLSAKLSLINNQNFIDEAYKKNFYNELLDNAGIMAYYHLNDREVILSSEVLEKDLNERLVTYSGKNRSGLWLEKSTLEENAYLYMGYSDLDMNETLILKVEKDWLFKDQEENQDKKIMFEVYFENELIYKNHNFNIVWPNKKEGQYQSENKNYYLYSSKTMDNNFLKYTYISDISREINYISKALKWLGLTIFLYFLIAIFFLLKSAHYLLKPLDVLIDRVSSAADGKPLEKIDFEMDFEFKVILNKFDDLIETSHEHMKSFIKQSEIVEEKNKIILDLNKTLELSTSQIESSTKEWLVYEKQSKILVDNIKDLMWIIDTNGRILYINDVGKEKLGYENQELLGVNLEALLKECIESEEFLENVFQEDLDGSETIFVNKQGEDEEIYVTSTKRIYVNGHLTKIQGVSKDITEERFLQKQLEQKNEIFNTLNEISEILTKPEKLESLLHQIVSRIEKLLEPYVCTIRLIDEEGRLELKAGIGAFYALVQEKYLNIDKDISGRAIKESKIIIVSEKDSGYYDNYQEISEIISKSKEIIFMPLEYNDHVIGVMSIGMKNSITESELKILKIFTNQASAAIEKARMYEELEHSYLNIIKALASTVEAKDSYTEDHSIRVSQYSRMIAEIIGLSDEEVSYIDIAGLLHDIGKIGVSDLTLTKKGKLTEEEFLEIKKHPSNGEKIVSEMKLHQYIIDGVLLHHKRFDLKGYPDVAIDSLPLSARIIGVADAFDAMTSDRSYQNARSFDVAYKELVKHSGTQFCPVIVEAMGEVIKRLEV